MRVVHYEIRRDWAFCTYYWKQWMDAKYKRSVDANHRKYCMNIYRGWRYWSRLSKLITLFLVCICDFLVCTRTSEAYRTNGYMWWWRCLGPFCKCPIHVSNGLVYQSVMHVRCKRSLYVCQPSHHVSFHINMSIHLYFMQINNIDDLRCIAIMQAKTGNVDFNSFVSSWKNIPFCIKDGNIFSWKFCHHILWWIDGSMVHMTNNYNQ